MDTLYKSGLVGTTIISKQARVSFTPKKGEEFLFEIGEVMQRYGVVKLDVCWDAFELINDLKQKMQ